MAIPLVLLHGYHSEGQTFDTWRAVLQKQGFNVQDIFIGNYVTENNEINVDDIAEGFDRALRQRGMADKPFDIVVHSTGMLVLRAWLTAPAAVVTTPDGKVKKLRQSLLKHLIGMAPATNGSPVAPKGRSLLGRIFFGKHELGPDFLASGNLVLNNLELASKYTWDLAHKDLFVEPPFYDNEPDTPYVFIFDGTNDLGDMSRIFDSHDQLGTDGIVRWAGASLNSRKIVLDFTRTPTKPDRFEWTDWVNVNLPLIPVAGVNHTQILSNPPAGLQDLVVAALGVNSADDFKNFYQKAKTTQVVIDGQKKIDTDPWQQFIVHAIDERGNGIIDYSIEVLLRDANNKDNPISAFEDDVHPYSLDKSFRSFHVRLNDAPIAQFSAPGNRVVVRFRASSGTDVISYEGFSTPNPAPRTAAQQAAQFVELDITSNVGDANKKLFYPFTTTFLEVRLNREPVPQESPLTDYEIFQFLSK
jgi:hypothetical protein